MVLVFRDKTLERLEVDAHFNAGFEPAIVRRIRRCLNHLRAAKDERDLYAIKSYHFEKLKGDRAHQRSIRVNEKWRMILEIDESGEVHVIVVVAVEDYH